MCLEIDREACVFTLKEKYRQVRRPLTDEEKRWGFNPKRPWKQELQATGLLQFSIETILAPGLVCSWTDTPEQLLEEQLPEIAAVFLVAARILQTRRRQLVGVLGWLDMRLLPACYPVLTGLLIVACIDRLHISPEARARIALVAAATTFAYVVLVFALLFITVTPVPAERVIGTQGRYFIVIVPLLALISAAFNPFRLPERLQTVAALALALIATMATLEAILRVDWS